MDDLPPPSGDDRPSPPVTDQAFALVYTELRRLAARRLAAEAPGQTLDATALVHEAYLRLVASGDASAPRDPRWANRAHFFAAAAEAMRRILVEAARRKARRKRGGGRHRADLDPDQLPVPDADLLALDDALTRLAARDPQAAELVKLRHFAGLTVPQAAEILGVSPRTADRLWAYARVWLFRDLGGEK
jgi:RNA polymerase sigma factor (TIGR02999 family)